MAIIKDTFEKGFSKVNETGLGRHLKMSPFGRKAVIGTIGVTAGLKIATGINNRINTALQAVYPENMLPTMRGKFGKRTDGIQQSPTQGVKFNFRRG